jgi:ATP-GRASP peptide maturase of grasp-with-spasm system
LNLSENKTWAQDIYEHIAKEINFLSSGIFESLGDKYWFDHPENVRQIRKLETLQKAQSVGLKIPETLVTNSKVAALRFLKENGRTISKPISDIAYFDNDKYEFRLLTAEVTEELLDTVEEYFFPTLFQKLILKTADIRVFFLNGQCFSMAIMSQKDPSTSIDFRNYNGKKLSRMIPYKLPEVIESSITKLMSLVNLKNGSLDFIATPAGDHYFLEINPLGQFGMTSAPCNYKLEKRIAQYLIKNDRTPN